MNKVIQISLMMGLFYANVWSQDHKGNGQWLSFGLTNDIVFQTDKYYTNGLNFEYITDNSFNLFSPLHFLHAAGIVSYNAITLRQDIFTPQKMNEGIYNHLDRPFASYLLVGSRKTSLDFSKKSVLTSSIEVGVLGKYSGGEFVQNGVHSLIPASSHVYGWENQVRSDLAINYGLELEKGLVNNPWFGLSGHLAGKVGLPHTYAGTGLIIRMGEYLDYFSNLGLYSRNGWQIYFFTKLDANFVLYNATLQGGIINPVRKSIRPELTSLIFKAKSGLHLSYKNYTFEVGIQQITPEFKNGMMHRWGYLSFTIQI